MKQLGQNRKERTEQNSQNRVANIGLQVQDCYDKTAKVGED
jgi:hypothetical protein